MQVSLRPSPQAFSTEGTWTRSLGVLTAVLGAAASAAGLLSRGPDPVGAVSVRGQAVELYGSGLYQYDTLFVGAGNRGTDLVTLVLGVPLLLACLWGAARGRRAAALLLPGAFAWFLYVYATLSVNAAYNDLFGVYVVLFAASLFGGALAVRALDVAQLPAAGALPRRLVGWLMLVAGVVTPVIWLGPVVAGQIAGEVPDRLDTYTTFVTYALDSAVIAPAAVLAGVLVLRGRALGYVIAIPLLVILAGLAPTITAQTAFQLGAGADVTPAEVVGPIGGFVVLAVVAVVGLVRIVRGAGRDVG